MTPKHLLQARTIVRALVTILFVAAPARAQLVTRVVDGDTIMVEGVGSVRLIGVDTPETVDPRKPVQVFGKEASDFTRRMATGKVVRLEFDFQRKDKYDRTLAYVYLPDGTFLNAEIVKQGYGHAYTQFPFKHLDEFRGYERQARDAGRGLWGEQKTPAVVTAAGGTADNAADPEQIVYITRTGTKYHTAGCRYLARSQIPIALKNVGSNGPCSVCRPPVLKAAGGAAAPPVVQAAPRTPPTSAPQPTISGRCQAVTKAGSQCSRRAQVGSIYCWQHAR